MTILFLKWLGLVGLNLFSLQFGCWLLKSCVRSKFNTWYERCLLWLTWHMHVYFLLYMCPCLCVLHDGIVEIIVSLVSGSPAIYYLVSWAAKVRTRRYERDKLQLKKPFPVLSASWYMISGGEELVQLRRSWRSSLDLSWLQDMILIDLDCNRFACNVHWMSNEAIVTVI